MSIEEGLVMFQFEYISPTKINVEETSHGVAIIEGTLLAEGISRNGNLYTVEEMEKIAKEAEGIPIYTGTTIKPDPNTGIVCKNMHANISKNKVGRIIRAVFESASRKIKFWAEIVNTDTFPNLIKQIRNGWGISIGGIATKAKQLIDGISGKIVTKIMGLKLQHVQLLAPSVVRGQDAARVENVQIQETMIFYQMPKRRVIDVTLGVGMKDVNI